MIVRYYIHIYNISQHRNSLIYTYQELHEAIREHSMAAGRRVKVDGVANDLLERIAADSRFKAVHATMDSLLDPKLFVGRCPQQVDEFISECIEPILAKHRDLLAVEDLDSVNV